MVHKHRLVFCCCFDSGTREITLWIKKGRFSYGNVQITYYFDPKSDLPWTRIEITSTLGLQCKQKHDLLLGLYILLTSTTMFLTRVFIQNKKTLSKYLWYCLILILLLAKSSPSVVESHVGEIKDVITRASSGREAPLSHKRWQALHSSL